MDNPAPTPADDDPAATGPTDDPAPTATADGDEDSPAAVCHRCGEPATVRILLPGKSLTCCPRHGSADWGDLPVEVVRLDQADDGSDDATPASAGRSSEHAAIDQAPERAITGQSPRSAPAVAPAPEPAPGARGGARSPGRSRNQARTWVLVAAGAAVTLFLAGSVAGALHASGGAPSSAPSGSPPPIAGAPGGCVAAPGAELADTDQDTVPDAVWPHKPGQRTVVYFETARLTPRLAGLVQTAAQGWSRGPCIEARAVAVCPETGLCSTGRLKSDPDDGSDSDREDSDRANSGVDSSGKEDDGVRRTSKMTFYPTVLDARPDPVALTAIAHEMGHVLGLGDRPSGRADVMSARPGDGTTSTPDLVDLDNLAVLYGGATPAPAR